MLATKIFLEPPMTPSEQRQLNLLAAGSILAVFLLAAVIVGYALHRSASHFEPAAIEHQIDHARQTAATDGH